MRLEKHSTFRRQFQISPEASQKHRQGLTRCVTQMNLDAVVGLRRVKGFLIGCQCIAVDGQCRTNARRCNAYYLQRAALAQSPCGLKVAEPPRQPQGRPAQSGRKKSPRRGQSAWVPGPISLGTWPCQLGRMPLPASALGPITFGACPYLLRLVALSAWAHAPFSLGAGCHQLGRRSGQAQALDADRIPAEGVSFGSSPGCRPGR